MTNCSLWESSYLQCGSSNVGVIIGQPYKAFVTVTEIVLGTLPLSPLRCLFHDGQVRGVLGILCPVVPAVLKIELSHMQGPDADQNCSTRAESV